MTSGESLRDPTGRHEYRYFDGATWTEHVADRGVAAIDPYTAPAGENGADPWNMHRAAPGPSISHQVRGALQKFNRRADAATRDGTTAPAIQNQSRDAFKRFNKWSDQQMREAAARVHRRSLKPDAGADDLQTLDDTEAVSVLGQWGGFGQARTGYAASVSGIAGSGEMLGVLRAMTGAQDAQERLLRSIDAEVDALVKGPYNTGRTHLREAQRIGAGDPSHLRHIEQANECFYTADGQAASVQSRGAPSIPPRPDVAPARTARRRGVLARPESRIRCRCRRRVGALPIRERQGAALARNHGRRDWFYPAGVVVLGMGSPRS